MTVENKYNRGTHGDSSLMLSTVVLSNENQTCRGWEAHTSTGGGGCHPEMINIVNGEESSFSEYLMNESEVKAGIKNYIFTNGRPVTKSMLAWWMFQDSEQELMRLDTKLEIEHIYPKKRQENENSLSDKNNIEKLGNKALLEENINIRASDYRFADKAKYYKGFFNYKGIYKEGTKDNELIKMATEYSDYTEQNILNRTEQIYTEFIRFVKKQNLFKG